MQQRISGWNFKIILRSDPKPLAFSPLIAYSAAMRTKGTATKFLGRIIAPLGRCLTPTAAKEIVSLHADSVARRRIGVLAAKSDAGTLTPEERTEYQLFVEVGDLVAVLQAKARRYLADPPAA